MLFYVTQVTATQAEIEVRQIIIDTPRLVRLLVLLFVTLLLSCLWGLTTSRSPWWRGVHMQVQVPISDTSTSISNKKTVFHLKLIIWRHTHISLLSYYKH